MKRLLALCLLLSLYACIKEPSPIEIDEIPVAEGVLPEGFDFETSTNRSFRISEEDDTQARYELFYEFEGERFDVGSFIKQNEITDVAITIPTAVNKVFIDRISAKGITQYPVDLALAQNDIHIRSVDGSIAGFGGSLQNGVEESCVDHLYAVNSNRDFFTIDVTNSDFLPTTLANLEGGGSIACALDQANGKLYYNVGKTMYEYDIVAETFTTKFTNNPFNGNYPRLEYYQDYFYMSNGNKLYKVDATTNAVTETYTINGFVNNSSGGDLAFDSSGELYLACFSGLYKFTNFGDGTANIVRISAENFPFQLTSMAIDRQDRIFVGTNDSNSKLIQISKEDGSYAIVKTYDKKINDLTAWKCEASELNQQDSDNDGVIDELDDYPNDPEAATDTFTPSALGMGTFAFEDFWPSKGDYDFNDMVIGYRYTNVLNSANKSVRLKMNFTLRAVGAGFHSGFGIELGADEGLIESVTGHSTAGNNTTLNAKGLEANQDNSVVIVFNDAFNHVSKQPGEKFVNTDPNESLVDEVSFEVVVEFVEPISAEQLGEAPFNPFIFSSTERGKEIHLSGKMPTSLADQSIFGTVDDDSDLISGKTYQDESNMPWAIHVIHQFRYPKEKNRISAGYNRFRDWARSGGLIYRDWYGDNTGYRNIERLYFGN